MYKPYLLIIITLLSVSCNNKMANENQEKITLQEEIENDDADNKLKYNFMSYVDNNGFPGIIDPRPIVFSKNSKLYDIPSVGSKVLLNLDFGLEVKILEYGRDNSNPEIEWFKITFVIVNSYLSKPQFFGYVKAEDIAIRFYSDYNIGIDYLASAQGELKLFKYDSKAKKIINSLVLSEYRTTHIRLFDRSALPGINLIFYIGYSEEMCGGFNGSAFIADVNGKLTKLISNESFSDDDPEPKVSTGSSFYFPIKFDNGNLMLIRDGNINDILDRSTGKLDTLSIPKALNFPAEQLIAEVITTYTPQLTKGDEEDSYNESRKIQFYRWKDSKLTKISIEQ